MLNEVRQALALGINLLVTMPSGEFATDSQRALAKDVRIARAAKAKAATDAAKAKDDAPPAGTGADETETGTDDGKAMQLPESLPDIVHSQFMRVNDVLRSVTDWQKQEKGRNGKTSVFARILAISCHMLQKAEAGVLTGEMLDGIAHAINRTINAELNRLEQTADSGVDQDDANDLADLEEEQHALASLPTPDMGDEPTSETVNQ